MEENRGLPEPELCSQIYRGETLGTLPENSALHANGVMTFHLLSEWRGHGAYSEGKLRTISIDYYIYPLKGQNVLWFPTGPNVVSHGYIYMNT